MATDRSAGARRARAWFGLLPVSCAAFAAIGLRDAGLGVAWPAMRSTFGQPLASLGTVLIAGTAGALVGSLASGRLHQWLGPRGTLVGLTAAGAVAIALVAVAPTWLVLVIAMGVAGLSAGGADAALNTVVALRDGVRGLGLLHAAFGAGAIAGPLLMAVVIGGFDSWRLGYGVILVLYLVVLGGFLLTNFEAAAPQDAPAGPAGDQGSEPAGAPPRHRAALVCSIALFFAYVGVESCAAQWAYSLFTDERGIGTVAAGLWLGGFWAAFTFGRLFTGVAGHRVAGVALLDGTMVMAAAGAALLWWAPRPALGGVGLVLLGLGLAAVYPTLVSLTPRRVGEGRASRAISYQVAAAVLGFALLPAGFGILAEGAGLELLGPVLLAGVVVVAALHRLAAHLE